MRKEEGTVPSLPDPELLLSFGTGSTAMATGACEAPQQRAAGVQKEKLPSNRGGERSRHYDRHVQVRKKGKGC